MQLPAHSCHVWCISSARPPCSLLWPCGPRLLALPLLLLFLLLSLVLCLAGLASPDTCHGALFSTAFGWALGFLSGLLDCSPPSGVCFSASKVGYLPLCPWGLGVSLSSLTFLHRPLWSCLDPRSSVYHSFGFALCPSHSEPSHRDMSTGHHAQSYYPYISGHCRSSRYPQT